MAKQELEVDLAGARLVAAGHVGDLQVRLAVPRSPSAASPGGMLCSTTSTPASRTAAESSADFQSYGYWYSTARKPARAAAAKRCRKSTSANIIETLAASFGIES